MTRQYKDPSGASILAATTTVYDRRGNVITNITEEGAANFFVYDGQNRLKISGGPATLNGISTQQVSYVDYDNAGVYMTNRDSLGMTKITQFDAVQRPVSVLVSNTLNGNALVSLKTTAYSSNHHAITVTLGSGSGAIANTTFYDSFNKAVLNQSFPTSGQTNFTISRYGSVLGYQAPTLSLSTPLAETLVWRSRRVDPTGLYLLGARYYDPTAGRFVSADPLGHAASWDLYSFCGGDNTYGQTSVPSTLTTLPMLNVPTKIAAGGGPDGDWSMAILP